METKPENQCPHKAIDPRQCPRCGGHNTDCLGNDGTSSTAYICRDCDAKNPDADGESPGYYEVIQVDVVGSVVWTDDEGKEHEVHDTEYLGYLAASGMHDILQEFVTDVEAVGLDTLRCDWPDLAVTYAKAKAILTQAKPPQGEKGA